MDHAAELKKIIQLRCRKVQMERRLKQHCQEIDKVAKYKANIIDEQIQLIHTEILNTRRSRVDASVVYLGVVPGVTVAPSVKPLPIDKDFISNIVQERHKRLKRKEKGKMRILLGRIDGDLANMFPEHDLRKTSQFLVPAKTFIQENHDRPEDKKTNQTKLAEIVNLVDNNRIRNRRNKYNRKHIGENMSTKLIPEITDQAGGRAEGFMKAKNLEDSKFADKFKNQLSKPRLGPVVDKSRLRLSQLEGDEFTRLYKECGKSRYLRRMKSPVERLPDITRVFKQII